MAFIDNWTSLFLIFCMFGPTGAIHVKDGQKHNNFDVQADIFAGQIPKPCCCTSSWFPMS